jgi:hypothetical protein
MQELDEMGDDREDLKRQAPRNTKPDHRLESIPGLAPSASWRFTSRSRPLAPKSDDAEKKVRVGTCRCLLGGPSGNQLTSGWEALATPAADPARLAWSKREDTLKISSLQHSIGRQWLVAALALPALALGCAAGGGGSGSAGDDPPDPTGPLAPAPAAPAMRAPAVPNPMAAPPSVPPATRSSTTPASATNGTPQNAGSEAVPDPELDVGAPPAGADEPGAAPGNDPAAGGDDDEEEENEEDEEEEDDDD